MKVDGASALVAGGASGLGAATARALHGAGASVVVADLNAEKGNALVGELGERARFVEVNVTDADQVSAAVDAAAEADGGLRISVCCAGIGWAQRTASKDGPHDLQLFSNVVQVNLIGTFNVLRLAAAAMNETSPTREASAALRQHGLDRRVRRPDRPGRLRGLEGRHRRPHPPRRARHGEPRHPRGHDRAGPVRHAAPRRAAQEARDALGATMPFPSRLGEPDEYAALVRHIVENPMLNGETIRLDGALRMAPR